MSSYSSPVFSIAGAMPLDGKVVTLPLRNQAGRHLAAVQAEAA